MPDSAGICAGEGDDGVAAVGAAGAVVGGAGCGTAAGGSGAGGVAAVGAAGAVVGGAGCGIAAGELVSVWAPALAVSAARPAELPPSVLVAVWGLAVLLPLVSGL